MSSFWVRMPYFLWKSLDFKGLACHMDLAIQTTIVWHTLGAFFYKYEGYVGGGQNCFQLAPCGLKCVNIRIGCLCLDLSLSASRPP